MSILNDTYGRSEYTKKEKALEDRKKALNLKALQGRAKIVVDHVMANRKQMTIQDIERYIKRERKRVALSQVDKYDAFVTEGLKEFLHNYFLTK